MKEAKQFQDVKKIYDFFQNSHFNHIAKTIQNNNITSMVVQNNTKLPKIMLIGGVHGNETEGVAFLYDFCKELFDSNHISSKYQFYIIPILNPDGFLQHTRKNANHVDLNRNLPTKDWTLDYTQDKYYPGNAPCSEIENQVLVNILQEFSPDFIISFHSWKPVININGDCMKHALKIQKQTNLEIKEDIGYPTPGSLGTYAGLERSIPTITLEIERGTHLDQVYPMFRQGVIDSFSEVK